MSGPDRDGVARAEIALIVVSFVLFVAVLLLLADSDIGKELLRP